MTVALVIALVSTAIAADEPGALNDEAFLTLRDLSNLRGCASHCARTAVALLKSRRYQCASATADPHIVCMEPQRRWQASIDKKILKNGMDEDMLLHVELTLANPEPRSMEALRVAYFPLWHLGSLALPEHGPITNEIYRRADKVDVSMSVSMSTRMLETASDIVSMAIVRRTSGANGLRP